MKLPVWTIIFLLLGALLGQGCATPPRRELIEAGKACLWVWHSRPFVHANQGHTLVKTIKASALYDIFAECFAAQMTETMGNRLFLLDSADQNLVFKTEDGQRFVDAASSAQKQGFDVLIEVAVFPSVQEIYSSHESYGVVYRQKVFNTTIHATAKACQVATGEVLWDDSYSVNVDTKRPLSMEDYKQMAQRLAHRVHAGYSTTPLRSH